MTACHSFLGTVSEASWIVPRLAMLDSRNGDWEPGMIESITPFNLKQIAKTIENIARNRKDWLAITHSCANLLRVTCLCKSKERPLNYPISVASSFPGKPQGDSPHLQFVVVFNADPRFHPISECMAIFLWVNHCKVPHPCTLTNLHAILSMDR